MTRTVERGIAHEVPIEELTAAVNEAAEASKDEAEARQKIADAKTAQHEAHAKMETILAPLRGKQERFQAEKQRLETRKGALRAKVVEVNLALEQLDAQMQELHKQVEDAGIPLVLIGVRGRGRPRKVQEEEVTPVIEGRTSLKPEIIGAFEPLLIGGVRRHGERFYPAYVKITCDGERFMANRVDKHGELIDSLLDADYTRVSNRLSDVVSTPGWLETKDVAYAIVHALGKSDEFPAVRPKNDPDTISRIRL